MKHCKRLSHFVLLEILIAFLLVGFAVLPFLHYPFEHMRHQTDLLYEMELEHLAQSELIETQISLYKKEIDPALIFGKKKETQLRETENVKVELLKGKSRTFEKKVILDPVKEKVSKDNVDTVFLTIKVQFFKPKNKKAVLTAQHCLVVQKKGATK